MRTAAVVSVFLWVLVAGLTWAGSPRDLTELSLEELMNVEVFTVARHEQSLFDVAAAVEVITGEEIRRSGVLRLPEALRLSPGIQIKHIDANKWAIAVRGFNNRFVNKLLVLVDGRSVYSPIFSGVYWEVQDLLLDDIERIEVIRGPGGSLWGANAVNGVINIITRQADQTQGRSAWFAYGPEERGFAAFRQGGHLGQRTFYRIYGKGFRQDALELQSGARAADAWQMLRGGFRLDGERRQATWTLSGEAYKGRLSQTMEEGVLQQPPYLQHFDFETAVAGAYLLGRCIYPSSATSELRLTGYYDGSTRSDVIAGGTWHTLDLDLQHRFEVSRYQTLIWGGEVRSTWDRLEETERFAFDPPSRRYQTLSTFLQSELYFFDARLRLILGTKLEHNTFTGVEMLPNLRWLWTDHQRQTVWGAVSRAVRLPTRAEAEGNYLKSIKPLNPSPGSPLIEMRFQGNPEMKPEELRACELGYRLRPVSKLTLDLAGYYHRYCHHLSIEPKAVLLDTTASPRRLVVFWTAGNKISGHTLGAELNAECQVHRRWRLSGGYAYLRMDLKKDPDSQDPGTLEFLGDNPRHRALLRSQLDLTEKLQLTGTLYYTGRLPLGRAERLATLDLHLSWRLLPSLELSLVGQNLFNAHRIGLDPEVIDTLPTYSQRSLFALLAWHLSEP